MSLLKKTIYHNLGLVCRNIKKTMRKWTQSYNAIVTQLQ